MYLLTVWVQCQFCVVHRIVHDSNMKDLTSFFLVFCSGWGLNLQPVDYETGLGACGPVDRVLDSRSEGLELDSHCWSCVEVSGKPLIPYRHCPPSSDGYLVDKNWKIVNGINCRKYAEFPPEEMRLYKREFQYQGCNLWSMLNSRYPTINIHIYIYIYLYQHHTWHTWQRCYIY